MDIGGSLFNSGFLGADFFWWIGQIADDSYWRDNMSPGKHTNKESVPGWGRRYKVRIIGLHDKTVPVAEELPWAQVMYPVTAGGGQASSFQTSALRQGNFVFGFFLDGKEQSTPVIMGVLGNNSQTKLSQEQANEDTELGPRSGFGDGAVAKQGSSKETVPETDLVVEKPKAKEDEQEEANSELETNNLGTPLNKPVSKQQQADIDNARREGEAMSPPLEGDELFEYIQANVKKGIDDRIKNANAVQAPIQPGATKENIDDIHLTGAADVIREDLYQKPITLMKPDDIVGSSMKSMQIVIDNLAKDIDKHTKSLQDGGYIDAVSMNKDLRNLKAIQSNAACEISKYMKIIMDKMMEYVSKTVNKELSEKVAQMPSSQRWMMADMVEITGQQTLQSYNQIADNMCGTVEEVLEDTIKTGKIMEQFQGIADNIVNQSITARTGLASPTSIHDNLDQGSISETLASVDSSLVSSSVTSEGLTTIGEIIDLNKGDVPTIPKVPVCYAEDLAAKIITANRKMIDAANDNIVRSMNYFMDDMQKMLTSTGATEDSGEQVSGEIMGFTDAEVMDMLIGGSNYLTATSVETGIFGNVNPGITTSKGKGCIVNIKVSSGGLSGYNSVDGAQNYEWISRGTNYVNGNQSGTICDTSGDGTGMVINMTVVAGEIQTVRVHTIGTGYKVGDIIYPHMQGGPGSIAGNGAFKLTMVAGPIDPGGIEIIKRGVDYQGGDVLFVNQNNYGVFSTDGTFTVTSTNTKPKKKLSGTGQNLDDILGKIGSIGGNITQALKFKNVAANVFPFELPPNQAVSDMYKMGTGGSAKPDSQLPSIENVAGKIKDVGKEAFGGVPFIEPSLGEPELIYEDAKNVINSSSPS
tara:strand:+ start:50 stop:2650 length:2601 start_codon:yes stop_codon:yes gene_type:complete